MYGAFFFLAQHIQFCLFAHFLLTVFAKLSEPKLSQLSSEDEEVSMGINFVFRNAENVLSLERSPCEMKMAVQLVTILRLFTGINDKAPT